jgi:hypothetical protein
MDVKVADRVWIATALLHREEPQSADFALQDIKKRTIQEFGTEKQPGVWQHIVGHAVASNPPSPARLCMLTATARGRRRLYRDGDPVHPERDGKQVPHAGDIPPQYHELLRWYQQYNRPTKEAAFSDHRPQAFLAFVGLIPAYDLKIMEEVIERDSEHVEAEEDSGAGHDAA